MRLLYAPTPEARRTAWLLRRELTQGSDPAATRVELDRERVMFIDPPA